MSLQIAKDEYLQALRRGHKEYKELTAAGRPPHPAVLDEILEDNSANTVQDIGLVEIPATRVVGTKSAGRITAFTANFRPLLGPGTEFAVKWVHLCAAHLSDVGIQSPIECYEYLGDFYVVEGNKRVSVMRHFDAARIPANVQRIVPPMSDEPRIRAYYEFMEFFKYSRLYLVQFRRPGDYAQLLAAVGKEPTQMWEEDERRTFNAYFQYFREAFYALNAKVKDVLPEEALLLWLKVHPYRDLGRMTGPELKKSLQALWPDVVAGEAQVQTKPVTQGRTNLLDRIAAPGKLNVAFVHQLSSAESAWVLGHEDGRRYVEEIFGDKIATRSYFHANTPEAMEQLLEQAVADGAQVVFTTAPKMSRATLRTALKYPRVHFLNCSVDQPYSSVRTYYGRMYEAKFITGAIAGAMAQKNRIGYIAAYPIFGEIASINAFALGAQLTNPRAQVELRWSCLPGTPQADLLADGVRVISNRAAPTLDRMYLDFCSYGTYLADDLGNLIPLGMPVWGWGKFYEFVIRSVREGAWKEDKSNPKAVNYWLGMDSQVISLRLSERLPAGVAAMAGILHREMTAGTLDPFARRILSQDGTVKNDGSKVFTPAELLKLDWLCENVVGTIPAFDELLPMAQPMVRELGIYRDQIPAIKENV
ncbi:MAG: BMP family ABC transporter substrate-binding protein [Oscillospiraceae bacterium]|nr:BMP family ABC transporter substrate-binding protein [Oscillospiraceae bacterium]